MPPGYFERARAFWSRPGQIKANREDILHFSPTAETLSLRYREIRVPVTIGVGEQDPFLDPEQQSHRLHREIPHARFIVVPDTAHMIPDVCPEAVLEAVRMTQEDCAAGNW